VEFAVQQTMRVVWQADWQAEWQVDCSDEVQGILADLVCFGATLVWAHFPRYARISSAPFRFLALTLRLFVQHALTPPQFGNFVAVFSIVLLVTGAFSCIAWFGLSEAIRVYFVGIGAAIGTIALGGLIATGFTNPGIVDGLSRQRDEAPTCSKCKIQQPRNAFHCNLCDCCVVNLDHHCGFIGRCIAKRNMRQFNIFVAALWTAAVFMLPTIGFCLVRALYLGKEEEGFWVIAGVCGIIFVLICFCPRFWMHLLCNGLVRICDGFRRTFRRICQPCTRKKAKRLHSELRESDISAQGHLPNPMVNTETAQGSAAQAATQGRAAGDEVLAVAEKPGGRVAVI
jgi:hypothetical protein